MAAKPDSGLPLGGVDQYVMLAILRQNPNAYGVSIREDIETRTKKTFSFGAIYGALDRLERDGLIESRIGESTPERGGRRKTHFKITGMGQKVLNASLSDLRGMVRGTGLNGALA